MPNPLMSPQMNTGKRPQTHEVYTPVEEEWEGENIPYRGTQDHGVKHQEYDVYDDDYKDVTVHTEYDGETRDPVPVKIVGESSRELRKWRHLHAQATDTPQRIIGAMENRQSVKLRNNGPNAMYVAPDSNVSEMNGYKLDTGQELSLATTDDVWAVAANAIAATGGWITLVPRQNVAGSIFIWGPQIDVSDIDSLTMHLNIYSAAGTTPTVTPRLYMEGSTGVYGANFISGGAGATIGRPVTITHIDSMPPGQYAKFALHSSGASADSVIDAEIVGYIPGKAGIPQLANLAVIMEYTVKV